MQLAPPNKARTGAEADSSGVESTGSQQDHESTFPKLRAHSVQTFDATAGGGLLKPDESEGRVLEGVLIPFGWGPSGEVLEVGLTTFDESEYRIDAVTAAHHGLTHHLRKHVRLFALVRGGRVIEVSRVEMLGGGNRDSPQTGTGPRDEPDDSGERR